LSKNPGVILLTDARSLAAGVELKQLRGLNDARRKMLVFQREPHFGDDVRQQTF
jgi:hypothetical protein